MFASGRTEDARWILEGLVTARDTQDDPHSWALLFTLYRVEGDWHKFDALASRFQVRFGRSAPAWSGVSAYGDLPEALRAGGAAFVQIAGALDARMLPLLDDARRKAAGQPSLHLDLSRVDGVDAEGAQALSSLVRFLAGNGNALLLTGSREVIELLRDAVSGDGALAAYWILLLDIYQLEGRRDEFERAAVEYALCAGVPAPGWETVFMPLPPRRAVSEQRAAPRYQAGPELITLSGAGEDELLAVREFAGGRRYVNIDLSGLDRLAPPAAAGLVSLANELAEQRVVRMLRPNPLVETLLETLELDPRVQLIRAQSL